LPSVIHSCVSPSCSLFSRSRAPRALHSFPTRRSSDLGALIPFALLVSYEVWARRKRRISQGYINYEQQRTNPISETSTEDASEEDRKSTRLNSSHVKISYAVFCLKKKKST